MSVTEKSTGHSAVVEVAVHGPSPSHFFASVDTNAGNGDAVYRPCLELLQEVRALDVERLKGQIHFCADLKIAELKKLRCFEKVYLSVGRGGSGQLDAVLRRADWESKIHCWEQVCGPVRSFRVNCKRVVALPCGSSSIDVERSLGTTLQDRFGWKLDMKKPHLEVWVFAREDETSIGLLLLRQQMQRNIYTSSTGLHPNVAWALVTHAAVVPGEVLLDPMCGTGTLLTEAPKGVYLVGVDKDLQMLKRAAQHLRTVQAPSWSLLRGDAQNLPLPSGFADVAVCDLPYGRQYGSVEENRTLYPAALRELQRVVKTGGRCVLLTSTTNDACIKSGLEGTEWILLDHKSWKLGNKLPAEVYVLANGKGWNVPKMSLFDPNAGRFAVQRKKANPELVVCS
eukprot:TRINITY_DN29955_c0_g1_i1.p1 TRINITY_DN29955_c0_g1~~TRINITY_DN29955_c0_g1_i1.p1  ORF type:complete len:397 (+),score=64.96 TRINITY_DN29955_c0_g1_i1:14-1204(+)